MVLDNSPLVAQPFLFLTTQTNMLKLPINGKWTQLNNSDKFGSLAYTKNVNLDEDGHIKLSPRMVSLSSAFWASAFGRYAAGTFRIASQSNSYNLAITDTTNSIVEDEEANNPALVAGSHGVWWQNRWYESLDTSVSYNTAGTWTTGAVSSLTSGKRHVLCVFKNRNTLLVSNGNVVGQYDTSHNTTGLSALTIPSDFEVTGMAYNGERVGIVTRLGTNSAGQNGEAFFFLWDGATTAYNTGVSLGAYAGVTVFPYKSSFVVVTSQGQLLYWNGGGFDELAHFPFSKTEKVWGNLLSHLAFGDNIIVDGDIIYINLGFILTATGRKQEQPMQESPSGVWCYDPKVGLYHRYSASISPAYLHTITDANINTTTNVFTTASTIPATGNPVYMTQGTSDLTVGKIYYVIKLNATTFKLATTKALAEAGTAIDITTATTSYFWMFDLLDYGVSYSQQAGAIAIWGSSSLSFRDLMVGSRLFSNALVVGTNLCTAVPFLENRGYFVTPRLYADSVQENIQKMFIKHRVLNTDDKIIVKVKTKDYIGIPVACQTYVATELFTWTSDDEGYTTLDLSEAKTALDAGEELEIEFIAGAGAGQTVRINEINYSAGTYSLVLAESVTGAASTLKSYFIIDNWKTMASVDATTQKDGVFEVSLGLVGKNPQIKIELRGYETCIEDIQIINKTHKPSV